MPKARIEDIPADELDPDDRTGAAEPDDIREPAEPPKERQDVPEDELRKMEGKG